jgi:hypothetical protein
MITFIADIPLDQPQKGPQGDKDSGLSGGTINESGEYTIYTGGKEGAPPGKYKVVIKPGMMMPMEGAKGPPKTAYNQMYTNDRDTPLRVEVKDSPDAKYDLELKP